MHNVCACVTLFNIHYLKYQNVHICKHTSLPLLNMPFLLALLHSNSFVIFLLTLALFHSIFKTFPFISSDWKNEETLEPWTYYLFTKKKKQVLEAHTLYLENPVKQVPSSMK